MEKKETESFYAVGRKQWREWLKKNHHKQQSVWLICYKANSGIPTLIWSEAVDEALCFGWIDSTRKSIDHEKFMQFFGKRKPTGTWSKINKQKVEQLIEQGLMAPAGLASIELAKENGSWNVLNEVEELIVPKDLAKAFKNNPGSKEFFTVLSKSVRKAMLQWLVLAKRPETRAKRILEIALLAAQNKKPKQF